MGFTYIGCGGCMGVEGIFGLAVGIFGASASKGAEGTGAGGFTNFCGKLKDMRLGAGVVNM